MKMRNSKREKWPEIKTKCFVRSYLSKSCLWNMKSPDYDDKLKKDIAYKALMTEFKILNLAEVKNKIRILRTTYTQEEKRAHLDKDYVPKLW